jgi:hypothetical protein
MTSETKLHTTFREKLEDGRELHHSDPAEELIELDEATLEQVALLGELYHRGDIDPTYIQGISLSIGPRHPIGRQHDLGNPPKPNFWDMREPNVIMFPLLDAFCRFLDRHRHELFRGVDPYYVRATGFGVEAPKETNLHCDIEREWYQHEGRKCIRSRAFPESGRLVVGLDTRLREDVQANLLVVDGDFILDRVVAEPEGVRTLEELDAVRPDGALVTTDAHSVIEIFDSSFKPGPATVAHAPNGTLIKQGSTTLHAGTSLDDAMRVGLQCWYSSRD